MPRTVILLLLGLLTFAALPADALEARIKDIARIDGVRDNPLQGFGLVVGLDNSGDNNSPVLNQLLWDYAKHNQINFPLADLRAQNVAAVVVTAKLPPVARSGNKVDVEVSSIGNAKSLQGGTLLTTSLQGPDGKVHALAMGPIAIGGFNAGGGGASITKNHPTSGRIPNGAVVEGNVVPTEIQKDGIIRVVLFNPDFTTASNVANSINTLLQAPGAAQALDMGTVGVKVSAVPKYAGRDVELIAALETVPVMTDQRARVIVDERTGTVVVGENVRIDTVAVSHSNFVVEIGTRTSGEVAVGPFGSVTAVTSEVTEISAYEDVMGGTGAVRLMPANTTIQDLVRTVNSVGMSPRDLISILQAIKAAGALKAELVIW